MAVGGRTGRRTRFVSHGCCRCMFSWIPPGWDVWNLDVVVLMDTGALSSSQWRGFGGHSGHVEERRDWHRLEACDVRSARRGM